MQNRLSLTIIFSLLAILTILFLSNINNHTYSEFLSSTLILGSVSILLVLCIGNNRKNGIRGMHGKSWMFFTLSIVTWFVAEIIWELDKSTQINNTLAYADGFWLIGYVFYFVFGIMYLKPFGHQISKKNIGISSIVVLIVLIPVLYIIKWEIPTFTNFMYAVYPIADSIMLIPSILGLTLFFKGRVRLSWNLLFIGMIAFVIADYSYMYFDSIGEYYPGHIVDIPYIWAYVIFIGGVNGSINLLKKSDKNKPYNDQNSMR